MNETMTFEEYLVSDPDLFRNTPAENDLAIQNNIIDWFFYRHICNDNRFRLFFRRKIRTCYNRYMELLKIENRNINADEGGVDWLVDYLDAISRQSSSLVDDLHQVTKTGTVEIDRSNSTSRTTSETTVANGTDTAQDVETIDTTDTHTDTDTLQDTENRNVVTSDDSTNSITYNEKTETDGTDNTENNASHLSKSAPMSAEYLVTTGGVTQQVPLLDWTSLTAQEQSGDTSDVTTHSETDHTGTNTGSVNRDITTDDDLTKNSSRTMNGTLEKDGTITKDHSGTNTNRAESSGTETGSLTGNLDTTYDVTNTNSGSTEGNESGTENNAGRRSIPADLLARARTFISGTSAWEWMYKQLDECFIGVYDY